MKNKRGFGKTWHFFSLNWLFLIFGIFQMVLWLIGLLLLHFNTQKKLKCWNYSEISWVFITESEHSNHPISSFNLACFTARAPIRFMNLFLWNTLLKWLEKWTTQIKLFSIPLAVCKRILTSMEYHACSYNSFSSFLCKKFVRTCNSM